MPPKKIVFIGDCGVGKTTIIRRYILDISHNIDSKCSSTIGAAYYEVPKYSKTEKVAVWDTAGQERFKCLAPIYYKGSQGCICVFDVTQESSFESCAEWLKLFTDNCMYSNPFILLVGNKYDCEPSMRKVSDASVATLSLLYDCPFIQTDCINEINKLQFDALIGKFVERADNIISQGIDLDDLYDAQTEKSARCSKGCF